MIEGDKRAKATPRDAGAEPTGDVSLDPKLFGGLVERCNVFLRDSRRPKQGTFAPRGPEETTILRTLRYLNEHGALSGAQVSACESILGRFERCIEINSALTQALRKQVLTLLSDVMDFCRSCATEMKPPEGYKYRELNPAGRNSGVAQRISELEGGALLTYSALSSPARALEQIRFLEEHRPKFVVQLSSESRRRYGSLVTRLTQLARETGLDVPWDDLFARYDLADVMAAVPPTVRAK